MPAPSKITDAEWQRHKATIRRLYMVENRKLGSVMREMSSTHGFSASKYQYTTRLNKWEMKKNVEHETWSSISGALKRRSMHISEANVFLNDQLVPRKKLKRELQRYNHQEDALAPTTPDGITIQPILDHIRKQRCLIPGSLSISLPWQALITSWKLNWSLATASPAALPAPSSVQIDSSDWSWPSPESYDATFSYQVSSYPPAGCVEPPILTELEIPGILEPRANDIIKCFGISTVRDGCSEATTLEQHLRPFLIEERPNETQRTIRDLMGPYSAASVKVLTTYMALMLSNDLVMDGGIRAFLSKAEKLHCLGSLTPLFAQISPSARAIAARILHAAVHIDAGNFLSQALKYGADVESPSTGDRSLTLLQDAIQWEKYQLARILINAGANVNAGGSGRISELACSDAGGHVPEFTCDCGINGAFHPVALAARSLACVDLIPELLNKGAMIPEHNPVLIYAIRSEASMECLACLISAGADVDAFVWCYDEDPKTPLSVAAENEHLEVAQMLLDADANPNGPLRLEICKAYTPDFWRDEVPKSPLLCAKKYDMIKLLLEAGADPNISAWDLVLAPEHDTRHISDEISTFFKLYCEDDEFDGDEASLIYPLQGAVYRNDMQAVKLLLQYKASPNSTYGTPALALALILSNREMAHLLLSHGADPNRLSDKTYRQSGLGAFVSKMNLQSNHRLLHSGMGCINCPAPCIEQIPLRGAADDGEKEILERIREQGAAMLSQPESIQSASVLRGFVRSGFHEYVLRELRSREVNFRDDFGKSSLVNGAILRGDSVLLGQLLAGGANVHEYAGNRYSNSHGHFGPSTTETLSPIQCAARMNCLGMARMLCIAGANINQSPYDQSGDMALHLAIRHSNYDVTKFLVEQNVGLGTYSKGETALFLAIKGGCNSILGLLLENGADPNQPCYNDGLSWMRRRLIPLDNACFDGTLDMVRALLHAGADTSQGYAVPSLFNSYRDHSNTDEILEILLQYGADVNNRCRSESTPLQRTILEERFHYTDLLIKAGAYINAPASNGERGRTALQAAVEVGNVDMVRRLILDNADVNAPAAPDQGVTALQAAAIQGYLNIAKILLEHGAVIDAAASPKNGCKAINGAAEFGRIDMVKLLLDNYHGPTPVSELCDDARTAAKKENQWYVIELLDTYEHPDEVST